MKKNAAKANIKKNAGKAPTKETVDTPMSECQAENPLECRFHGQKALQQMLPAILGANGYYGEAVTDKLQGNKGYEFRINGTFHMPNYFASHIAEAFEKMGYSCAYQGKVDGGGHSFIVKKAKGKKKPTLQPAEANNDEVDLLDDELADLDDIVKEGLEDKEAKSNHNPFEGIDITEEDIAKAKKEQEGDDGKITDADIEDFLAKNNITPNNHSGDSPWDQIVFEWKGIAINGKLGNGKSFVQAPGLTPEFYKKLIDKAGADHKVSKALMKHLNEQGDGVITDEEIKDYLIKGGVLFSGMSDAENTISTWKNYATKGEDKGHKISTISGIVNALISKVGADNKISKALQNQLDNADGETTKPTNETASDEGIDLSELDEIVKEKESENSPSFTDDELLDFVNKVGWYKSHEAKDEYTEEISKGTIKGQPLAQGHILALKNAVLKVPTHPVSLAIVKTLNKLKSEKPQEETEQKPSFTDAELKDFMEKNSWPSFPETYKEMILKGTMNGNPLHDSQIKALEKSIVTAPLHPVALAITKTLNKIPGWKGMPKKAGIFDGGEATEDTMKGIVEEMVSNIEGAPNVTVSYVKEDLDGTHKYVTVMIDKPTGIGEIEEKDVFGVVASKVGKFGLQATQFVKGKYGKAQFHVELWPKKPEIPEEAKEKSVSLASIDDSLMKPLEHDESKFPKQLTLDKLNKAIANGKSLGGNSGEDATRVEIDGKLYVVKSGSGSHKEHLLNEAMADKAYRDGGINVPDFKLYHFGNKTYKLAEFIEGKKLSHFMLNASEEDKDKVRKDLLKGFPLDVLFSNWDVIGTSRDNVIVDKDGRAWRIDNGGSFGLKAMGGKKDLSWAKEKHAGKVAFEDYDENGGWEKRQWIDDFRTMRRDSKNKGLFDGYSTADIFLAAGNINLNKVVESIPDEKVREALKKPLFEMKQMAFRAVSADLSGIKNNEMLSVALDAAYESSKQGWRELCTGEISFSSGGIGAKKSDKGAIPPYPVPKPEPPEDPTQKFASGALLSNAEYHGTTVSNIILNAAKTINYHAGFKMTDAQGNKLGGGQGMDTPDYSPNSGKIAAFKRIEREKLAELAKTDDAAKAVLDYYDSVATSMENGFKLPVQEVKITDISSSLPGGFKTKAEIEFETNKDKAMAKYHADLKVYNEETLPAYLKDKHDWEENEKAKLKSSGHGLEGNFYDIANEFMEAAYDTNGIAHHNGESIDFIELGKHQNKFGGNVSGSTTENDSWTPASSHIKVLDLLLMGKTLDEIINISNADPLINNGHHSGKKAKDWFIGEAQKMAGNMAQTKREMAAYAVFKGLQVVKLENESAKISLPSGGTLDWIDHQSHTVGLIRKESYDNSSVNKVAPIVQKGANSSCGFQSNGAINEYPYAYDVPLWFVSYTYSDENHKGSKVSSHQGSEHEWVANLIGLTPFRVSANTNASQNMYFLRQNADIKKARDARIARLAPFSTSVGTLKNITLPS